MIQLDDGSLFIDGEIPFTSIAIRNPGQKKQIAISTQLRGPGFSKGNASSEDWGSATQRVSLGALTAQRIDWPCGNIAGEEQGGLRVEG